MRLTVRPRQVQDQGGARWIHWARQRKALVAFALVVLLLPMILSPTHPVATYVYLTEMYAPAITPAAYARTSTDLADYLLCPRQIARYQSDLLEDMLDTRTGHLFAIVRRPDGSLGQDRIRTWNGLLPAWLPTSLLRWMDRKEIPFLGDEVDTWTRGNTIIAMGHYHAFGGGPSDGDRQAQDLSEVPEIVVANGVIPTVYLDGRLVPYGDDVNVEDELLRHLRTLDRSLTMEVLETPIITGKVSPGLKSFLAFLRDYRGVDIRSRGAVASETWQLCLAFKSNYQAVFLEGFITQPYHDDSDKVNMLRNLASLQCWSEIYRQRR